MPKKNTHPALWVNTTYFAEGLPYMLVRIVSTVFFTDIGVKERFLGYLNFLGIPWNLKFLWAPLLDLYASKKRWLIGAQLLVGILTLLIAALCWFFNPAPGDDGVALIIAAIFIVSAFVAATNDIAIDAYYLETLSRPSEQALWSGHRVLSYRLAMIFARSGLVALAAYVGYRIGAGNKYLPWAYAFSLGGICMIFVSVLHSFILHEQAAPETEKKTVAQVAKRFKQAFISYLSQEKVVWILLFACFYKIGDDLLFSMTTPFLMRELGISKEQYAWIAGIVVAVGLVIVAIGGGWYIKQKGLRRAIWPLTLFMNLNIWAYIMLAYYKPSSLTLAGVWTIASVHGYEQFAAGIGSAVLLIFLLGTCKQEFKATHYAIGTAFMSLPSNIIGGYAGRIVEARGYVDLYLLAFVLTMPSMLLIPLVPIKDSAR